MDAEAPPPEAELIERLRREFTPRLSVNRASKMAALSEARWRQIAKGYQQVDPQTRVAVRAPSDTLARMAYAVSATPKQLRNAGREDAADELELLLRRAEIESKPASERTPEEVVELSTLPPIVPVQADKATALQAHPMIKAGVPLEEVARTLQTLIDGFERRAASSNASRSFCRFSQSPQQAFHSSHPKTPSWSPSRKRRRQHRNCGVNSGHR